MGPFLRPRCFSFPLRPTCMRINPMSECVFDGPVFKTPGLCLTLAWGQSSKDQPEQASKKPSKSL